MSRVNLLNRRDVPELEPVFAAAENRMGFVPNSQLVMVYKPKLLQAFTQLGQAVHNPANKTSRQLRLRRTFPARKLGLLRDGAATSCESDRILSDPERPTHLFSGRSG
jgi:hypothetical protein